MTTSPRSDVHGNLWRGFENFLLGREPNDAITFTQRICGVCPGSARSDLDVCGRGRHGLQQRLPDVGRWGQADGPKGVRAPDRVSLPTQRTSVGQGVPFKAVYIRNLILSAPSS